MKDKPGERNRRSGRSLRRFESAAGFILACGAMAAWVLNRSQYAGFESGVEPFLYDGVLWPSIAAILALIALNAVFIAAETSIELLRPRHVKHVKEIQPIRAERLQALLDGQTRFSAAHSLGSTLTRIAVVLLVVWVAPQAYPSFADWFGWAPTFANVLLTSLLLLVPVGIIHLVFGELVPKSFSALHPVRTSQILFRFSTITAAVLGLPAIAIAELASLITTRFGGKASFAMPNAAEEEILTLVESAGESGEMESEEKDLIRSVFSFTDTVAREVMTPRVHIDAMPLRSDPTEVVNMIQETGHSRIPLYEGTDDQIVGIIHAKDLLLAMLNGKAPNLRKLMRPAIFVPENKNLHELLSEMRQQRSQLAVVQDEFGGTAGILTIEDIVEELVGDIVDEYDVEEPAIVEADGAWLIEGRTHVDDVSEAIGADLPSEEFDTIGGYVFGLFGRQPQPQEAVESDGFRFTVAETDGRRIARLRIERAPSESELEPAEID